MQMKELAILLKNISILYVEDDYDTREEMTKILLEVSDNITVATSGSEALEYYYEKTPQIIISDIAMPNLNGIEFIRKVRNENIQIPIILLTAHADVDYLLPAANLNIQSYIVKPINIRQLKEVLFNAVEILNINSNIYVKITHSLKYDKTNSEILSLDDKKIKLNRKEKNLIDLLLANQNRVVTYSEIEQHVWMQFDEVMTSMALRTVVKNLRKKISTDFIRNISGQGYKLIIA
ncbi:response regulator transcription factor [Poseidonibacter lekithochrous]|uniref:response regulator transcription factor n=1 Tax=Poseidonibacter lekithochrous TaxID=1904463 RepID=UPI0008FC9187|nr:response regulator transcription factor [Poseidonibacter lekithochrous]QKJ22680.1 two-component system response regulator [Poseidonibacter lekithochrous]